MMKIAECVSWVDEDDLCMVINTNSKKCIMLDDSGKIIWHYIREKVDRDFVCASIIAKFVSSDSLAIRKDVEEFFNLLIDLQILVDDEASCDTTLDQ